MPAGNNTGSNSDYRVSDPPPATAQALKIASTGAAFACLGTALSAFACLGSHRRPLAALGFLVTVAGLGLVVVGLQKIRSTTTPWLTALRPRTDLPKVRSLEKQDADKACAGVVKDVRYDLAPGEKHNCPEAWPTPCLLTFHKDVEGDVGSILLTEPKCDVCLTTAAADLEAKSLGGYSIVVTPLA